MDPDARDFATFGATHEKTIGAIYRRARAEVGFDLDRVAFSSRLHAVAESVLAESPGGRRQVDKLLAAIESADLYLATAAAAGNREALTRLHRWYGPLLRELGEAAGRPDLEDELIGGAEAPPPLASYLGLGSLRRWLLACAARVLAPPRPAERLGDDGPRDPEARRAADLGPVRALAALPPELRFAVALQLAGGVKPTAAPAIAGISARRHAAAYERLLALTERETDRKLVQLGEDRRRQAWTELHRALGVTGRREVLAALAHDGAVREMVAPTADCPDPNFLLGALDRVTGVARDEVLEHAARCWPCLHAARSLGPPQRRAGHRRLQLALACALLAGVAGLAWFRIGRDPAATSVAAVAEPAAMPTATSLAAEFTPTEAASRPGDLDPIRSAAASLPTHASAAATPPPVSTPAERPPIPATVATPAHVLARVPPLTTPPPGPRLATPPTPPPAATPDAEPAPPRATSTPDPSEPVLPTLSPAIPVARAAAPPAPALRRAAGESRAARVINVAVERYEPGLEARALAMIVRAIEIDPDLAVAHFDAAVLLERSGEHRRALSHWARYLHLAGGSEDTTLARDRLGR